MSQFVRMLDRKACGRILLCRDVCLSPVMSFGTIDLCRFTDNDQPDRYHSLIVELLCPRCLNTNLVQALRRFYFVRGPCHTRIARCRARATRTAILCMAGSRVSGCDQKISRLSADRQSAINELLASTSKLDRKES